MPTRTPKAIINPNLLSWARESSGLDSLEVARRIKQSEEVLEQWEMGQEKPTMAQLRTLAVIYKRSLGIFFLPCPPKGYPLPKDRRVVSRQQEETPSAGFLLAIRKARNIQSAVLELYGPTRDTILKLTKDIQNKNDPEPFAEAIRAKIGIDISAQFSWKHGYKAFNEWRKAIENTGVFVSQMRDVSVEEARAFCINDRGVAVIVINNKDSIRARIFSLFHEYCHVVTGTDGICDICDDYLTRYGVPRIEVFCNRFAGALLVPQKELLSEYLVQRNLSLGDWPDDVLSSLGSKFNVSPEVILRRLTDSDLARREFYELKHRAWEEESKKWRGKKKGTFVSTPDRCIGEVGPRFVSVVLANYHDNRITATEAAEHLGVRLKHFRDIEIGIQDKI